MVSYHSSLAYDDLIVTVRARLPKSSETSEVCELAEVRSTYHHAYWVVSGEELNQRPVPDMLGELEMEIPGVEGRWVDAGDLRPGDVLFSRETGTSTVQSVDTEHQQVQVFHIYVEELHNYAVGDGEWLVHNSHGGGADDALRSNQSIRRKTGGRFTEPHLPPKTIASSDGVTIDHYTRSGDHGPPHLHIKGGGAETRIGQMGRAIDGSPVPTPQQQRVIDANLPQIRSAIDQIMRWFRFENSY